MLSLTLELYEAWKKRLIQNHPTDYQCICAWLLGYPNDCVHSRSSYDMIQRINYRYRILEKRYLNKSQKQAYRNLIYRLFTVANQHSFIGSILQQHKNSHSWLINLIQQILAHLINYNYEIKKNMAWIGKFTQNSALREALMLASLEEYCCQLVNGQPMLIYKIRSLLSHASTA